MESSKFIHFMLQLISGVAKGNSLVNTGSNQKYVPKKLYKFEIMFVIVPGLKTHLSFPPHIFDSMG